MCLYSRLNLEKSIGEMVRKREVGVVLDYQIQTRLFGT